MTKEVRMSPPTIKELMGNTNHPYFLQRQRLAMFLYANQNKTEKDFFI